MLLPNLFYFRLHTEDLEQERAKYDRRIQGVVDDNKEEVSRLEQRHAADIAQLKHLQEQALEAKAKLLHEENQMMKRQSDTS